MAVERAAADSGPLPLELLLRSSGGDDPFNALSTPPAVRVGDLAAVLITLDATAILQGPRDRREAACWAAMSFARRVEQIRGHLAPIAEPSLLLGSFGREAAHARPAIEVATSVRSPVRVAYAIRWIELMSGLSLPEWSAWSDTCTPIP